MSKARSVVSVVVPVRNEQALVPVFYQAIAQIFQSLPVDFELVFVDDGSTDKTVPVVVQLHQHDHRVKLLRLSRHFGKDSALTAGLRFATGDAVVPMDVDFQDPPELLPQMVALWKEGHPVVLAKRVQRHEGWWKKTTAWVFYRFFNALSEYPIPVDVGDFRLMDRRVVDTLNTCSEHHRFMKGLFAWVGFPSTTVSYERPASRGRGARMTWRQLRTLARTAIYAASHRPATLWTRCGTGCFIAAVYMGGRAWWQWHQIGVYSEITGGIACMLLLSAFQLWGLGTLGRYIARIQDEVRNRPIYVVSQTVGW